MNKMRASIQMGGVIRHWTGGSILTMEQVNTGAVQSLNRTQVTN